MSLFFFFYIILRGLIPQESSLRTEGISCSSSMNYSLCEPFYSHRVLNDKTPNEARTCEDSVAINKFTKIRQLLYCALAARVILPGDSFPNPGWTQATILNQPSLKIGHFNIRSLPKHLDEFRILIQDNPFDVMGLLETWLNSKWSDSELLIDGYNIIRSDQRGSQKVVKLQFIIALNVWLAKEPI